MRAEIPGNLPRYRDADIIIVDDPLTAFLVRAIQFPDRPICLPVRRIYFPVRSRREFALGGHVYQSLRRPRSVARGAESAFSQYFPVTRELERAPTSGCARVPDGARA